MAKTFKLVATTFSTPSSSSQQPGVTNWELCMICQEDTEVPLNYILTYPSKSERKDVGSGYSPFADNLVKFNQLGQLPFTLERLDDGSGIEMIMKNNSARYHQSCKLKYNRTKAERAEKRLQAYDSEKYSTDGGCMQTRSNHTVNTTIKDVCFFCGKVLGECDFCEAATFQ